MEIKIKESLDMNDATPLGLKNCLCNCSECSSNIEIEIKEYLKKMKKYNNIKLNDDICEKHKKEYISYCFDCNIHLCQDCLKTKKHNYHYIINIIGILPEDEKLKKIGNIIQNNKKKINDLKKSKIEKETKLYNFLVNSINEIKKIMKKNNNDNNKKEEKEIQSNSEKYQLEITKLKKEYEDKMRIIKLKYNNNINEIRNKYKIINNKNENIYNKKIKELNKKIELILKQYKYDEKIEQKINYNEIIEIIYNT